MKLLKSLLVSLLITFSISGNGQNRVYIDKSGVIRWIHTKKEVALFGANYSLPFGSDFRAVTNLGLNHKDVVNQDMLHFARMGWDGMRLCLWGDFELTDKAGNLISNEHLDLVDYTIAEAAERGIYILLSPISTYSSLWPDAMSDTSSIDGISKHYAKADLGKNPEAIAAQVNYIKQLLRHVNPYTGNAIKDEPSIVFIEPINEPVQYSDDPKGSIKYINTLFDAIESTGCKKLLFYNVSQDMKMAKVLPKTKAQGVTFAWYPTGLVGGNIIEANVLRTVDDFTPMHTPELSKMAKIVYEFDVPDTDNSYMYPAITRSFRSVGAQFAAMFSYDMIATAPYNLVWQTHWLNMVYSPQKAVGAIIASQVMKSIPRNQTYGTYPENTKFGPFRVSYDEDLSEMITSEKFMYGNSTNSKPSNLDSLKHIVGYGSSPVITYEGQGIYFLDKIKSGLWRLEVYPDAKIVSDPYKQMSMDKVVSRLVYRNWLMTVKLPDLGNEFYIKPLNDGNNYSTQASSGAFNISPGAYLLSLSKEIETKNLPKKIGEVGLTEFECPKEKKLPVDIILNAEEQYIAGSPVKISVEVIDSETIEEVSLNIRGVRYPNFTKLSMNHEKGYTYSVVLPQWLSNPNYYEYCIEVSNNKGTTVFPSKTSKTVSSWDFFETNLWNYEVVKETTPLRLLYPQKDFRNLSFTRIGDNIRWGIFDVLESGSNGSAINLYFPQSLDKTLDDYTMSLEIKDRIKMRKESIKNALSVVVNCRTTQQPCDAYIGFMEADGTTWSHKISLTAEWQEIKIPLNLFKINNGVLLPLSFPERWNYWSYPAKGRGENNDKLQMDKVERLQISLRPDCFKQPIETDASIEVSNVCLEFK